MEERRLRRVEVFRLRVLLERAAAEGDDAAAQIGDRKHHPVAEAVVGHRDVVAGNQQPGLDHVLDRYPFLAEMLLEREALGRRIAEAELELRRRIEPAVGEIAARLGAGARGERRLEEFRRQFDHVVERLAPLARGPRPPARPWAAACRPAREPLDRLREGDPLGHHHEIEDVAVLAGGEVEPRHLLVVDEERRRLLLVERREALPLAARLLQFARAGPRPPKPEAARAARREIGAKSACGQAVMIRWPVSIGQRRAPARMRGIVPVIHRHPPPWAKPNAHATAHRIWHAWACGPASDLTSGARFAHSMHGRENNDPINAVPGTASRRDLGTEPRAGAKIRQQKIARRKR